MKVRIGLVLHENISKVEELTEVLESAIEAGEMKIVDKTSTVLIDLIEEGNSVDLDEAVWKKLNETVRSYFEEYSADHIISGEIAKFLNSVEMSALDPMLRKIASKSVEYGGIILQIPFGEEFYNAK